jgi:hypothetical protein
MVAVGKPVAKEEERELARFAKAKGFKGKLQPWDKAYWIEKLSQERFGFDEEALRDYFPMERVLEGLFALCKQLFDVTFERTKGNIKAWHKDVRFYRVKNAKGAVIAGIYFDPYARPGTKRGGAWMNGIRDRDFETREYKEDIAAHTFEGMYRGVENFVNEYNFKQFMQTIRGAGFISPKMITSNMALDFAYALFLMLQESDVPVADRKRIVQKWYVLSILTQRYSASPESAFAKDLKVISEVGIPQALKNIEDATLSDNFWNVALVQNLSYASSLNPTYLTYLAAQVRKVESSLLSNTPVSELINFGGDVHHIFPKKYLMEHGFDRTQYNQTANYAYLDTPVNISIGKKAPKDYFSLALQQCGGEQAKCGSIMNEADLRANLAINCIPEDVFDMDYTRYAEFLEKRRALMAAKIRKYYEGL